MNFSDKIKYQREQNHLTQKELVGTEQFFLEESKPVLTD